MRILVSGAHGFIGSHLCEHLLQCGHEVVGLASPWGDIANLHNASSHPAFTLVRCDIADASTLATLPGYDGAVHAAARVADWGPWEPLVRTNVVGTRNLIDHAVATGALRFVFISSVSVHRYRGFRNADPRKTPRDQRNLPYARSKILAEDLVLGERGLEGVVVRPGLWPFGPRDRKFPQIIEAVRRGILPLVDGGNAVLNTAYVTNLVRGIGLALLRLEAPGRVYVIGDEGSPSWRELFDHLAGLLGVSPPWLSVPAWLACGIGSAVEHAYRVAAPGREPPLTSYRAKLMARDVHFDLSAAARELGYEPPTSWQVGLDETVRAMA